MKQIFFVGLLAVVMFVVAGCGNKNASENKGQDSLNVTVADTALYGTVSEGTSMHSLEVKDENGKTQTLEMDPEETFGGVFGGDRITLTFYNGKVTKLINLTSLCGKWSSLDRNFTINEDGTVESHQPAETMPYTQWSMVNCHLILNVDTFDVNYLGPDSLTIENKKGIYVYKRIK